MENKKRSFFERLTGSISMDEEPEKKDYSKGMGVSKKKDWIEEENEEAELSIDVYETATDIIVRQW